MTRRDPTSRFDLRRCAIGPLSDGQIRKLADGLLQETRVLAPGWTGYEGSDPGVTLLALFAFLAENLKDRPGPLSPEGVAAARRLSDVARALAGAAPEPEACGVERVAYYAGQVLGTADFLDEQSYFRARLRRRNLYLHGAGVVSGLRVTVSPATGPGSQSVVVEPGFALDPRGEEIEVCRETAVPLPLGGRKLFVQLLFVERPTALVPSAGPADGSPGDVLSSSRIEETFTVELSAAARADAVSIGQLTFFRGRWQLDPSFKPARA